MKLISVFLLFAAGCALFDCTCSAANPASARALSLWNLTTTANDGRNFFSYSTIAIATDRAYVAFAAARFRHPSQPTVDLDEGKIFSCPLPMAGACSGAQLFARGPSPSASGKLTGRSLSMVLVNSMPMVAFFKGYGVCVVLCSTADCATSTGSCYNETATDSALGDDYNHDYQIAAVVSQGGAKGFFAASAEAGLYFFSCNADCTSLSAARVPITTPVMSLTAMVLPSGASALGMMQYDDALQNCAVSTGGGIAVVAVCADFSCSSIASTSSSSGSPLAVPCATTWQPLALSFTPVLRLVYLDYSDPSGIGTLNCAAAGSCTSASVVKTTPPTGALKASSVVDPTIMGAVGTSDAGIFISTDAALADMAYACASESCTSFTPTTDFDLIVKPVGLLASTTYNMLAVAPVDPAADTFVASYWNAYTTSNTTRMFALQYSQVGESGAPSTTSNSISDGASVLLVSALAALAGACL